MSIVVLGIWDSMDWGLLAPHQSSILNLFLSCLPHDCHYLIANLFGSHHHIVTFGRTGSSGKSWAGNRLMAPGQVVFVEDDSDESYTNVISSRVAFMVFRMCQVNRELHYSLADDSTSNDASNLRGWECIVIIPNFDHFQVMLT